MGSSARKRCTAQNQQRRRRRHAPDPVAAYSTYPHTVAAVSSCKRVANEMVAHAFANAQRIIVLDTYRLYTCRTLVAHSNKHVQITVVEQDPVQVTHMRETLARDESLTTCVRIVCEDVFAFLHGETLRDDARYDAIWLDLMASDVPDPRRVAKDLRALHVHTLAITQSGRGSVSYAQRARALATLMATHARLYKHTDWGYKLRTEHQPMFLSLFGRKRVDESDIKYRVRRVQRIPQQPELVYVWWWGYPHEPTVECANRMRALLH